MKFTDRYAKLFQYLLPTPFTIALIITIVTFLVALFVTKEASVDTGTYALEVLGYWEEGLWQKGLMVFAMQMMLILVLGHVLALSPAADRLISTLVNYANSTAKAAYLVTLLTVAVALFNWGLGLIFGAIFARKVAEQAQAKKLSLNYPLIGAAGYSGLMVWHGGISGSSLAKVAEQNHLAEMMKGIIPKAEIASLPVQIPFSETVFSGMNIYSSMMILLLLPLFMFLVGRKAKGTSIPALSQGSKREEKTESFSGAEKLDHSKVFAWALGLIMIAYAIYKAFQQENAANFGFITPNYINFLLLGLGILLHGNFARFLKAVNEAIGGAAGILIQFPLYFGIMGMMKSSGLVQEFSAFFVSISNENTFPIFTMISAGIVNVFVPSGGGQWAVQGPIIVQATQSLGISLPKSIMALAYGDQLTNMLQPFWALPLLGITKLQAKDILPYTLVLMLVGGLIYLSALMLF
ncbi:MAG: TIGR00366 family protein [Vicingaceae bacterium]